MRSICRDEHMPGRNTVLGWLGMDNEKGEVFRAKYARAREVQADSFVDEMIEIADDGTNDWMEQCDKDGGLIGWRVNGEAIARSKLRIETRRWNAAKLRPKKYGEATILKHADAEGEKMETQETSILELARLTAFLLSKAEKIVDKRAVSSDKEG
jgi:hypothetical protein